MAEPDIRFLGERIDRIQTELRELRGLRTDIAHLRAEMGERHEGVSERFESVDRRFDNLDQSLDNLEKSIDARFDQVHQTMSTNLAVVLAAIKGTA